MSPGLRSVDVRVALACFAVASLQQAAIWNHVAWGDEIQAVILARDSNSLSDWYWNFRYEGHPPLWHVYLKGWLVAGLDPLTALKAAASSLSLVVMGLIYFASPFGLGLKILISLCEPVLFHFSVVSRSYTLGVALLFIAAALWRARGGWLVIPVFAGVSVQFVVLAAALTLVRRRDGLPWRACAAAVGVSAVAAAMFGRPGQDHVVLTAEPMPGIVEGVALAAIFAGQLAFPQILLELLLDHLGQNALLAPMAATLCLVIPLFWAALAPDPFWRFLAMGFLAFTLAVSVFVYPLYYRHFALIIPLMIAVWWVAWPTFRGRCRVGTAWLATLVCAGLIQLWQDLRFPYSNAAAFGAWAGRPENRDIVFVAAPSYLGAELAPFITGSVKPGRGCFQTFLVFRAPEVALAQEAPYRGNKLQVLSPEELSAALKDIARTSGGRALAVADGVFGSALLDLDDPSVRLLTILDQARRRGQARLIFDVREREGAREAPPRCSTRP